MISKTTIVAAGWLAMTAPCNAQNCVVSGGTNFGTIQQNCAPSPQIIPIKPAKGQQLIPTDGPNGTFIYQVFVKIIGPIDVRVVACGEDVSDLIGSPWPSGMASVSDLKGLPQYCIGKQFNQTQSGTWLFQTQTKSKDKPVSIEAASGSFNQIP